MINPQWLELPLTQTSFHGPKDDRAIESRLYIENRPNIWAPPSVVKNSLSVSDTLMHISKGGQPSRTNHCAPSKSRMTDSFPLLHGYRLRLTHAGGWH